MPSPIALASLIEPVLPDSSGELEELASGFVAAAARLDGRLAGGIAHVVGPLFRAAHTHHSLYIEDRPSTLKDLARAAAPRRVARDRDRDADLRASIEVLSWLHAGEGRELAMRAPTDLSLLRALHERFYFSLPESARIVRVQDSGREVDVAPGRWREERVTVGSHDAPPPDHLDDLLDAWARRFAPEPRASTSRRLLLAISSHHRLLYIHPFRDGNGRVARFALDAYLIALGLDAKGAWTPARGFARARTNYYDALAAADEERRHATDGRGTRSAEGLARWCRFVLSVFREQADFVSGLLDPAGLNERRRVAVASSLASTEKATEHAARLVRCAWELGPVTRGTLANEAGVPDRSARRLLTRLEERKWVRAAESGDAREARLVGALPLTSADTVFPNLFLPDAT